MFVNFMKSIMAVCIASAGWSTSDGAINLKEIFMKSHADCHIKNAKNELNSQISSVGLSKRQYISGADKDLGGVKKRRRINELDEYEKKSGITSQHYDDIKSEDGSSSDVDAATEDEINTSTSSNDSNKGILEEVEEELDSKSDSINNLVLPSDLTRAGENIFLSKLGLYEPTLYDVRSTLLSSKDAEEARELINCLKSFEHGDVIDLSYILSVAIEKFGAECIPVHVQQCVDSLYLKMGLSIPESRFSEEEVIQIKLGGIYWATHVDQ